MKVLNKAAIGARRIKRTFLFFVPAVGDFAIMIWMLTELWDTTSNRKGRMLLLGIIFLGWEAFHKLTKPKRFKPYSARIWRLFTIAAICFWIYGESVLKSNLNT